MTVSEMESPCILVLGARPERPWLTEMLAQIGFRASGPAEPVGDESIAPDGSGAWPDTIPTGAIDAVVLDVDSPDAVDAAERACRSLRNHDVMAVLPLVAVLDDSFGGLKATGSVRARLLEAGADACLTRPLEAAELSATFRALLRIRTGVVQLQRTAAALQLSLEEQSEAVERWHALFSSSSAGIVTIDHNGFVQAWNPSAERMFGWKAHEVIGRPPPFIPAIGDDEYRSAVAALAEGRQIPSIETVRLHRDGTPVRVALSRAPITDEHGRSRGSIATLVDVSQASVDRERAAEMGALLSTLVDRAPIGLAFLDNQLRFQRVNQELADLDGLPTDEHADRHVTQVLVDAAPTLVPLLEDVLKTRTPCLDVELAVRPAHRPPRGPSDRRSWLASLYPVETAEGALLGAGLIIYDVTEQRRLDAERSRLFHAEHVARQRAQQLQTALAAVAAASSRSEVGQALVNLGLPALGASSGALCLVDPSELDQIVVAASTGYEDTGLAPGQRLPLDGLNPLSDAISRGRPVYLGSVSELQHHYPHSGSELLRPGNAAWAALPLRSGGEVLGVLGLAFSEPRDFKDQDLLVFGGFVSQAADALARAGRQEAEHDVAVSLQKSLLTTDLLPTESTSVAVKYLPAMSVLEVGGDFYDAVHLDEHRVLLMVGDVVGHGLEAAVAMGQLRSAAQALANAHGPAGLLSELDRFVLNNEQTRFATVACVLLDPVRGEIRYSLAGHPPPMVRRSDGTVVQLSAPRGTPLGTTSGPRLEGRMPLSEPSLVVLYTDGLIERRHESITTGLDRLATALGEVEDNNCVEICDRLTDRLLGDYRQRDDAAIVCAATRPATMRYTVTVPSRPSALASLRAQLRDWLTHLSVEPDEISDILVAVIEAATNAVEHAGLGPNDHVIVDVEHVPPGKLTFVVRDNGTWRDGSSDPYRGRGIAIMHRLMDHVDISVGAAGTTVTLRKHLDPIE